MKGFHGGVGLALMLLIAGCGDFKPEKGVTVTGKAVKGGAPFIPPKSDNGMAGALIALVPTGDPNAKREGSSCRVKPDGTFKIVGAGAGIQPGKYNVFFTELAGPPGGGPPGGGPPGAPPGGSGAPMGGRPIKEIDIPANKLGGSFDLGDVDIDAK
jgi:hypothetical protein